MAQAIISVDNQALEVNLTVGRRHKIESFDSVKSLETGEDIKLTVNDMHSKVFRAVAICVAAGDLKFEAGEDPDRIFIDEEGLALFDETIG